MIALHVAAVVQYVLQDLRIAADVLTQLPLISSWPWPVPSQSSHCCSDVDFTDGI